MAKRHEDIEGEVASRRADARSVSGARGRPRHHRPRGGFRNPWPGAEPKGLLSVLRWMVIDRLTKSRPRDPDPRAFVRRQSDVARPRAAPDRLSATWVGHSTVLLQVGGLNVLTDPVWSDRASPLPFAGPRRWVPPGIPFDALPPIDVVLLSHNHYDHLDARTVRRLAAAHPNAGWATPLGVAEFVRARGARNVVELDWWQEASIGRARVACAPAQHFSARGITDRNATLWCSWVLEVDRGSRANFAERRWSIFFGGDSGYHPEYAAIGERYGPFDVVMLPVGAYEPRWFMRAVHMDPEEAVRAFGELQGGAVTRPSALLPIHWGTFKLTDEAMDEPPRRVRQAWTEAANRELWLLDHGETRWWDREGASRAAP